MSKYGIFLTITFFICAPLRSQTKDYQPDLIYTPDVEYFNNLPGVQAEKEAHFQARLREINQVAEMVQRAAREAAEDGPGRYRVPFDITTSPQVINYKQDVENTSDEWNQEFYWKLAWVMFYNEKEDPESRHLLVVSENTNTQTRRFNFVTFSDSNEQKTFIKLLNKDQIKRIIFLNDRSRSSSTDIWIHLLSNKGDILSNVLK